MQLIDVVLVCNGQIISFLQLWLTNQLNNGGFSQIIWKVLILIIKILSVCPVLYSYLLLADREKPFLAVVAMSKQFGGKTGFSG